MSKILKFMKLLIFIGLLSVSISTNVFAKTKVLNFSPTSIDYTNVVQDVAIFQEECQNKISGHYYSKLYDFNFYHDANGNCIINYGNDLAAFRVALDDDATHVVQTMHSLATNGYITYDLYMKKSGMNNHYTGTCTIVD